MVACCCKNLAVRELWRLRLNWLFFILTSTLVATNISSVTSFHQFTTNPTPPQSTNANMTSSRLEPGLGLSESLYALSITLYFLGEFIGALATGVLIQIVPHWYIALTGLLLHTLGYVMYALTTQGWMLMLSKLLSGGFLGVILTQVPTYFSLTSDVYMAALKELDKDVKNTQVKDILLAFFAFVLALGFLIGIGATVVFSQFDINQFRAIAWFNVAAGLGFVVLLLVIFRGESGCTKLPQIGLRFYNMCGSQRPKVTCSDIVVVMFLIISTPTHGLLHVTYVVLINPILSDSFGFSEKESGYAFLGLVIAQVFGAILIIILKYLKLSNRISAIIGLILSITALILLADWQSIPYDPCTEFSLYHHPELRDMYRQELRNVSASLQEFSPDYEGLNDQGLHVQGTSIGVHLQELPVVENNVIDLAANKCEAHHISTGCHWIPISSVTKQNCTDCQPICRSVHKTLNFIQFCIGAMLLLIAHPTTSVSMTNLITDVTHKQLHGIVIGIAFAVGAVSKIISPLWIDAAYEGTKKRSFLPMSIMVGINLAVLLSFIILYPKLGKRERDDQESKSAEGEESDEDSTELSELVSKDNQQK